MSTKSLPIIADVPSAQPRLGFEEYSRALSSAIRGGQPPQFTVGIYGPWGSGKSSLLNALAAELSKAGDTHVVYFDAWRYERSGPIVVPLLHAIYQAIKTTEDKQLLEHTKRALAALIYSINFKLGAIEVDPAKAKDAWSEKGLSRLDEAFAQPFEELRRLPAGLGKARLAVLIDDLDRCSADNVVGLLESINLVMDVPGFIFVLAMDYDMLVRAVSEKYPHAPGHMFIEKMIQVPFRVPRLDLADDQSLRELLPDWENVTGALPSGFSDYGPAIMSLGLDSNPRQIKRFVNAFLVLHCVVEQRGASPNFELLASLIGLGLRWPQHYRELSEGLLSGVASPLQDLLKSQDEPMLQRYAERFFAEEIPSDELQQALLLTASVAGETAVPSEEDILPMSEVREQNREALIEQLEESGFRRSPRSDRLYYHPRRQKVRFSLGKTHVRFEKFGMSPGERHGDERWRLVESYLLTREVDEALKTVRSLA